MADPDAPAIESDLVAVDFETTGRVAGYPDEPWQLGMVWLSRGRVDIGRLFGSLLHVGPRPFHPHAPGRHAELRREIAAAPNLAVLWPALRPWFYGHPLAAHNAATERKWIRSAGPLHRAGPWIDTLKLARLVYPVEASHTLEDLLRALDMEKRVRTLCPDLGAHDAVYDAVGCGVLLEHLLALPVFKGVTVADLAAVHPARFHREVARRGRTRRTTSG